MEASAIHELRTTYGRSLNNVNDVISNKWSTIDSTIKRS